MANHKTACIVKALLMASHNNTELRGNIFITDQLNQGQAQKRTERSFRNQTVA